MKIEQDQAQIFSGVRHGLTLGSPIALLIENKDWANWTEVMAAEERESLRQNAEVEAASSRSRRPCRRLKYWHSRFAEFLERASARETAARVACGAFAKQLLTQFGVEIRSHVIQLGGIPEKALELSWEAISAIREDAPLSCADEEAQQQMVQLIDQKRHEGDTLGGIFEVSRARSRARSPDPTPHGPASLMDVWPRQSCPSRRQGSRDRRGHGSKQLPGSEVHDEIAYNAETKEFIRDTNRAGGLEGGITNGEELRIRGHLKPISTLRRPLRSVDIDTKQEESAAFERSDITVVPAAGVIGEAMVALVLGSAMREKFGGDSLGEMKRNFEGYREQLRGY